jgi:hypothetical protein
MSIAFGLSLRRFAIKIISDNTEHDVWNPCSKNRRQVAFH